MWGRPPGGARWNKQLGTAPLRRACFWRTIDTHSKKDAMDIKADIRTYGIPCAERQKLGAALTKAITDLYECRRQLEAAKKQKGQNFAEVCSDLQAARATFLAARRQYEQHLLAHRCMTSGCAAAATST